MYDLFESGLSKEDVVKKGHDEVMVDFIVSRYMANLFKSKPPKIAEFLMTQK